MSSVIKVYQDSGLLQKWNIRLVPTYREGPPIARLAIGLKALLVLLSSLLARRVVLVHLHSAQKTSYIRKALLAELAHMFDTPYIFHIHGAEFDNFYESGGPMRRWWIRRTLRNAASVVALSEGWKTWLRSVEPKADVSVVHNPVQIPTVAANPGENGSQILFLGRLGARKGVYELLEAVKAILPTCPGLRLVCAGDGEIQQVRRRVEELELTHHVTLPGWVTGEKKAEMIRQSSVFVLPSHHEGLPMSVLECMAYGLPVVTTRLRGMDEAVTEGVDGFLVDPGNIQQLAQALTMLLSNQNLRSRIGAAARDKAMRKFSTTATREQLESLYRRLFPHAD